MKTISKSKNKLLIIVSTIITVALICVAAIVLLSPKAGAETEGIFTYTVSNDEATITACDTNASGEITIPETLGGYPVTVIGDEAFKNNTNITGVNFSSSIKLIGESAFWGCSGISDITIPGNITEIGVRAFDYCDSIKSITLSNGIETIRTQAFYECSSLTNLFIPESVTSIGSNAFGCCTSLTNIRVNENNPNFASDEYGVLFNKSRTEMIQYPIGNSRTSYDVPEGVQRMFLGVFKKCNYLESVTIPDSVLSISFSAFENCENLSNVKLGNGILNIYEKAFCGCNKLSNIDLPYGLTEISNLAFSDCTNLTNITIPESVTKIGSYAFRRCSSLKSITIPNSVTTIGVYLFEDCINLENALLGNSLTCLSKGTFNDCEKLKSVNLPAGLTIIDQYAFDHCKRLESIDIPNTVATIGCDAFWGCSSLKELFIPESVINIANSAFRYCSGLTQITVDPNNPNYSNDEYGALFDKSKTVLIEYPCGNQRSYYEIPESVVDINCYAFANYSGNIKTLKINSGVKTINGYAFHNCKLSDVYYTGTREEWNSIEIGTYNTYLTVANLHFLYNLSVNLGNEVESKEQFSGDTLDFIETPLKEGYTFSCWLDENGESTEIPVIMPENDLTFTASWTPNYYDAVFNANGGKWADGFGKKTFSTAFDSAIEAPETPDKQGYIFSGWSLNGENIGSLPGGMDDVNGKEYTAIWIPATDTVYKAITYTMNTSGEYEESVQILSGETDAEVSAELPEISNGFTLNKNASTLKGIISADNSLVLEIYIDRNVYSFTVIDGEKTTENKYFYGQDVSELGIPVKDGYVFDCWLNENGETAQIGNTMPDKNIVLTAKYKRFQESPNGSVSVSYEDSCFDEEAFLSVKSIESNHEDHGIYIRDINLKRIKTFNIKMENSKNEEINPNPGTSVTVTIQIPEDYLNQENYTLIHIIEGNKNERFSTNPKSNEKKLSISDDGKYFIFEIDHFSYFVLCVEQTPVSIKVASAPNKTSYFYKIDKSLDTDGFALEVTYDDGSSEIITDTSMMTFSGFDSSKADEQTVTVEYGKLKTDFKVNVIYTWWQWIIRILLLGFLWY